MSTAQWEWERRQREIGAREQDGRVREGETEAGVAYGGEEGRVGDSFFG